MAWLAQHDKTLFAMWCEQLIRADAPLLRRLALHGMIEYAALSWDNKLRWLLAKVELHARPLHHEILPARAMRLSACTRGYAPAAH